MQEALVRHRRGARPAPVAGENAERRIAHPDEDLDPAAHAVYDVRRVEQAGFGRGVGEGHAFGFGGQEKTLLFAGSAIWGARLARLARLHARSERALAPAASGLENELPRLGDPAQHGAKLGTEPVLDRTNGGLEQLVHVAGPQRQMPERRDDSLLPDVFVQRALRVDARRDVDGDGDDQPAFVRAVRTPAEFDRRRRAVRQRPFDDEWRGRTFSRDQRIVGTL